MASLIDLILGRPLTSMEEDEEKLTVPTGVPALGLDALSSAAYGPEAALSVLLPLGALGLAYVLPITGVVIALLFILYFSYRQTISAYPNGGGSYTVAKENLGEYAGLVAAASLMVDYILNVAVGISAGVGALVSAVPSLYSLTLWLCLGVLALITVVNMRGYRSPGLLFGLPTLVFVASLAASICWGVARTLLSGGHPQPVAPVPPIAPGVGTAGLWLLLRSFASGCTAMTGVEAVSNGVSAFREPRIRRAEVTLTVIIAILAVLLAGIAYLAHAFHVGAMVETRSGYQSVISQLVGAVFGRGPIYYVTIASVLAVLCLSANTSFADFPRVCRMVADDGYLPHSFSIRGRRLVYTVGILILSAISAVLLIVFGGITDRLIPLFAVGAFSAFTFSQSGMVMHWKRKGDRHSAPSLIINAIGAICTAVALIIILAAKFTQGAWIIPLLVPAIVLLFLLIHRHYEYVGRETACTEPVDLEHLKEPIVLVPIGKWTSVTEKAIRFGLRISSTVICVHVAIEPDTAETLRADWSRLVEVPARRDGVRPPDLVVLASPYRMLLRPVLNYVDQLAAEHPDTPIAVIVPELVETHWWEVILHNQRAYGLKRGLIAKPDRKVVMIDVPWHLGTDVAAEQERRPPFGKRQRQSGRQPAPQVAVETVPLPGHNRPETHAPAASQEDAGS